MYRDIVRCASISCASVGGAPRSPQMSNCGTSDACDMDTAARDGRAEIDRLELELVFVRAPSPSSTLCRTDTNKLEPRHLLHCIQELSCI